MKTNVMLIISGIILTTIGVYRAYPVAIDKKFLWNTLPITAFFLVLICWAFIAGGTRLVTDGMNKSLITTTSFLPLLIILPLVMGFGISIALNYSNEIRVLLNGKFGMVWGLFVATLSPTSNAFAGFVKEMWIYPELRPKLLYFLTAVPLMSINILIIRQMGLGLEITKAMYKCNVLLAVTLLVPFWIWGRIVAR